MVAIKNQHHLRQEGGHWPAHPPVCPLSGPGPLCHPLGGAPGSRCEVLPCCTWPPPLHTLAPWGLPPLPGLSVGPQPGSPELGRCTSSPKPAHRGAALRPDSRDATPHARIEGPAAGCAQGRQERGLLSASGDTPSETFPQ